MLWRWTRDKEKNGILKKRKHMLFANPGEYEPSGLFTTDHFKLIIITVCGIIGGIVSIILSTTSLPTYTMWHIVILHSFLYHE